MIYFWPLFITSAIAAATLDFLPHIGSLWPRVDRLVFSPNIRPRVSPIRKVETLDDAEESSHKWLRLPPDTSTYPFPSILLYPSPVCDPKVKVVAAVLTIPSATALRAKLRQLHKEIGGERVRVIFPLGRSKKGIDGESVDTRVVQEAAKYGDILLADFHDSYEELPQKSISAMAWFSKSCPQAPYFIKIDDDAIVNWGPLLEFLDVVERDGFEQWNGEVVDAQDGALWTGRRWDGMGVIKDPKHRNYEKNIDKDGFPPYLSGPAYMMNRKIAKLIIHQRHEINYYLRNEDAMMGILMESTGIEPTNNRRFITAGGEDSRRYACLIETNSILDCACENWFSYHVGRSGPDVDKAIKAAKICANKSLDETLLLAKRL